MDNGYFAGTDYLHDSFLLRGIKPREGEWLFHSEGWYLFAYEDIAKVLYFGIGSILYGMDSLAHDTVAGSVER